VCQDVRLGVAAVTSWRLWKKWRENAQETCWNTRVAMWHKATLSERTDQVRQLQSGDPVGDGWIGLSKGLSSCSLAVLRTWGDSAVVPVHPGSQRTGAVTLLWTVFSKCGPWISNLSVLGSGHWCPSSGPSLSLLNWQPGLDLAPGILTGSSVGTRGNTQFI
jgi:hypothetical protein